MLLYRLKKPVSQGFFFLIVVSYATKNHSSHVYVCSSVVLIGVTLLYSHYHHKVFKGSNINMFEKSTLQHL